MTGSSLDGKRVLVVGASAGLGQAFAIAAAKEGAHVAMTARRADRLQETRAAAGSGTVVAGDVRNADDVQRMVDETVEAYGAIDLIVYAAGYAPLQTLAVTDVEAWRDVFETNVVGVNHVITAAIDSLAPGAIVVAIGSESANQPRFATSAYGSSKAALETMLLGWRTEHPTVRFSCIAVGATQPTEFGINFDYDLLGPALEHWAKHGLMQEEFMATDDVAAFMASTLGAALAFPGIGVEHITLRSPSPVIGSAETIVAHAERRHASNSPES